MGLALDIVLVVSGLLWAVPTLGEVGWAWTALTGLITLVTARNLVRYWHES